MGLDEEHANVDRLTEIRFSRDVLSIKIVFLLTLRGGSAVRDLAKLYVLTGYSRFSVLYLHSRVRKSGR